MLYGCKVLILNNSVELEIKSLNCKHTFLLWFVVGFGTTPYVSIVVQVKPRHIGDRESRRPWVLDRRWVEHRAILSFSLAKNMEVAEGKIKSKEKSISLFL